MFGARPIGCEFYSWKAEYKTDDLVIFERPKDQPAVMGSGDQ
jgi:hypothetical protein